MNKGKENIRKLEAKIRFIKFFYFLTIFFVISSCGEKKDVSYFNYEISKDPQNGELYFERGKLLENENKKDAINDYSKAIDLNCKYLYAAYKNRGLLFLADSNFTKAKEDFDKAIIINPEYSIAYFKRSDIYIRNGEYEKAIEDLQNAYMFDSDLSGCKFQIGLCYYKKGLLSVADSLYSEALENFSKSKIYYIEYEKELINESKSDEVFKEILKNYDPKKKYYYNLMFNYANVFSLLGNKDRAVEILNSLKEMNKKLNDTCDKLIIRIQINK